jgi:hypothetical protein
MMFNQSLADEYILQGVHEGTSTGERDATLVRRTFLDSSVGRFINSVCARKAPQPLLPNYGAGNIRRTFQIVLASLGLTVSLYLVQTIIRT